MLILKLMKTGSEGWQDGDNDMYDEYLLMKMTEQKLQTINKCQTSIVTMFHWITLMTLTVTAMKMSVIKHSKITATK